MTTTAYNHARASAGVLLYGRARNPERLAFVMGYRHPDDRLYAPRSGTHAYEYWRAGRDHARRGGFIAKLAALFHRKALPKVELDEPTERTIGTANRLFDHPRGCLCSTCELAARLGATVRRREGIEP